MARGRLLVLLTVVLLGGCLSGDGMIEDEQLQRLVLQPQDLEGVWLQFGFGPQTRTDAPTGKRADLGRFDRRGGWISRYRRPSTARSHGALVVESKVDLFGSSAGAEQELDAAQAEMREIAAPEIGEETVAGTTTQQHLTGRIRYYTLLWRQANVTASIVVQGIGARIHDQALALARRQEQRIERALS